jgi:predicted transposase/invertase (TIGR01784 family)
MAKSVNNPHDKFVKEMLSDRELAIDFLQAYLPGDVSALLDIPHMEYANTSFISPELEETFADIVVRIPFKSKSGHAFVSLLLEAKSQPEKYTIFQILSYLANGYATQIKQGGKLHPIVPCVYYQGRQKWKLRRVSDYFEDLPAALQPYLPAFDTIFVSLFDLPEDQIIHLGNALLRAALMVQRYRYDTQSLLKYFIQISSSLEPYIQKNFLVAVSVYILSVTKLSKEEIMEAIQQIPSAPVKDTIMNTYRLIKEEGKIEGKIEVVLNAYANGLSLPLIANITGLDELEVTRILKEHGKV